MSNFNKFNPDILRPSIKVNNYNEAYQKSRNQVCIFNNTTMCEGSNEVNYLFDSINNTTGIVGFHRNTINNTKINHLGDGVFNIKVNGENIESINLVTLLKGRLIKTFPLIKESKSKWTLKYFTEKNPLLTTSIPFVEYFLQIKFSDNETHTLVITSDHYILPPSRRGYLLTSNFITKNLETTLKYSSGFISIM